MKRTPRRVRIYKGVGTKAAEKGYPDMLSRWRCPHCKCGVKRKNDGTAYRHAIGGGNVTHENIPCLGSGAIAKKDTSRKVRVPKLSVPDGTVES